MSDSMTKEDIKCYRINYGKGWLRFENPQGWIHLPSGIIEAIHLLCDEVERLQKRVSK